MSGPIEATVEDRLAVIESHISIDLTLRDWFASHAIAGLLASNDNLMEAPRSLAVIAWGIADAMLAERATAEPNP